MIKLSTGCDSTLGNYKALCILCFGPDSSQVKFIDEKIAQSPLGNDEEVIADERQMLLLLASLDNKCG